MNRKMMLLSLGSLLILQLSYIVYDHFNPPAPREVPRIHSDAGETGKYDFQPKKMNPLRAENLDLSGEKMDEQEVSYEFEPNPFSEYLVMNPDFTGWISIDDTSIDHPIVKGRDNSYYLEHNFYDERDDYGAVFMDYRNVGNGHDDHTLIYGHHTETGHMFADFEKYLTQSFYEENKIIEIQDLYKKRKYKIISVHIGPADLQYINDPFQNDGTAAYGEFLKEQSLYDTDTDIEEGSKLLTLISCNFSYDDGRLYVHAVEV